MTTQPQPQPEPDRVKLASDYINHMETYASNFLEWLEQEYPDDAYRLSQRNLTHHKLGRYLKQYNNVKNTATPEA